MKSRRLNPFIRALIEISSILFLFYSNLLMGEFNNTGIGTKMGLIWALQDIFTFKNFIIGSISGFIGYQVFEYLRGKFRN